MQVNSKLNLKPFDNLYKQLYFIVFRFLRIAYKDQQKGLFPFVVSFLLLYRCFILRIFFPCLCTIF